jgi:hypothetical protein
MEHDRRRTEKLYGELKDRHGAETTWLMLLYN